MASNNIDESAMLKYVVFCLQVWDIDYISKDTLKKAREGAPQCCIPLTRLLFDLAVLDTFSFEYTLQELGLRLVQQGSSEQFMQEFVLAYLSEYHCPLLQYQSEHKQIEGGHCLAFGNSRLLLIAGGWLMSKIEFFGTIKSKIINKAFTSLYIERKNYGAQQKQKPISVKKHGTPNQYSDGCSSLEVVQKLYRSLSQHQFRVDCLARKKSQIMARLTKDLSIHNKKNGTNVKLEAIISENTNDAEQEKKEELKLEGIIIQCNKSMKNQQYFWMWLQFKVVEAEHKSLQEQFAAQFEKVDAKFTNNTYKTNPQYLSLYNQQFRKVTSKINEINEHMQQLYDLLNSVKAPKNQITIMKETLADTEKILHESRPELTEQLGIPSFLKLQVLRYSEQFGYNKRAKKNKKSKQTKNCYSKNESEGSEVLKNQIRQFVDSLQQLKFL